MEKLRVGITQGDANGIGPEVIIKALAHEGVRELMIPVIFADSGIITFNNKSHRKENFSYDIVESAADAKDGRVNLVAVEPEGPSKPEYGKVTEKAGRSAFDCLEAAVEALEDGLIDVLVTGPINKASIQNEDFHFPGHTEYLEDRFADDEDDEEASEEDEEKNEGVDEEKAVEKPEPEATGENADDEEKRWGKLPQKAQMILFNDSLRVALLSTHLPLAEVSKCVTLPAVVEAVRRFDATLRRDFGCERPRIAVLSLNPHAGDNGLLGAEEKNVILPALKELRDHDILAFGPYAADGFFGKNEWLKFDGVLAMYHDQGLAPFKTIAGSTGGVNFTAGLDIIRTSPDHGTAYDIAGKKKADATSMRQAIYSAIDIYRRRERYDEMMADPLKTKS